MKACTTAVILMGGHGSRLYPLTTIRPKSLIELCGVTILDHQIQSLIAAGIQRFVFAVTYGTEYISNHLKGKFEGTHFEFAYSEGPLGTGGQLRTTLKFINEDEDFFVLNCDVLCDINYRHMLDSHRKGGLAGTIAAVPVENPERYGVIIFDENKKILNFVEKPKVFVGKTINAGIYILNRAVVRPMLEDFVECSLERQIFPKMVEKEQMTVFVADKEYWIDIGVPHDLLVGQEALLRSMSIKSQNQTSCTVHIGPSVKVGVDCNFVNNVSIGEGTIIGDGVRLENVSIMAGCRIEAYSYIKNCIIGWNSKVGKWCRLENMCILGENSQVAEGMYQSALILEANGAIHNDHDEY